MVGAMTLKQVSVFLENRPGRLAYVTRVLADAGLSIRAVSISDTIDFGVLRLVLDDPDRALDVLKRAGLMANVTEVLGVEIPDLPGGLAGVLEVLKDVNIEYMYSFLGKPSAAWVLFRVEELEKTIRLLQEAQVPLVYQDAIEKLHTPRS